MNLEITLDDYVSLLFRANKSSLLSDKFALVTRDQANKVKEANGWDKIVQLVLVENDELNNLKQLNLIKGEVKEGDYYQLYRLIDWLTLHLVEEERRKNIRNDTLILVEKERRVHQAIIEMSGRLKMDYKVATEMVNNYVLKGFMPDIARELKIEDLVNFKLPKKI